VRLALSGGGTGGHVYPALSIAAALDDELPQGDDLELLYVGSEGGAEDALVGRSGISFAKIASAPIRGRMPWQMAASAAQIALGVRQGRSLIDEFRPAAMLSTGGYASFPLSLAARTRRVPIALYLPDLRPGWAVRAIAKLAKRIAVSAAESLRQLPGGKTQVTGYPVRSEFWTANRDGGRERLGLNSEEKVLYVAGASQGAHSINRAVAADISGLLELCEVVHLCGPADEAWLQEVRDGLSDGQRERYQLFGYMHEDTPWAMAAADLAVCRSGASVIGELPAVGLPAVLVPYPHAGGHQRTNAHYMEIKGAAVVMDDDDLKTMLPVVGELLYDEGRLREMREASRKLARPDAASRIARILLDLAVENPS